MCTSQFVSLHRISNSKDRSVGCHWLKQVYPLRGVKGQRFLVRTASTPLYCAGRSRQARLPSSTTDPLSVTLWSKAGAGRVPGWRRGTSARVRVRGRARGLGGHCPRPRVSPFEPRSKCRGSQAALLALNRQKMLSLAFLLGAPIHKRNNDSS